MLIQSGDPQQYHEVNEAFHNAIYDGAHNAYLADLTLSTRSRVQPFRRAQFRNLGRLAKSHIEHDRVVEAILRGETRGRRGGDERAYSVWCGKNTSTTPRRFKRLRDHFFLRQKRAPAAEAVKCRARLARRPLPSENL